MGHYKAVLRGKFIALQAYKKKTKQKNQESSNKKSNFTHNVTWKRKNSKAQSEQTERLNKCQSKNKWNSLKNYRKDQ